LTRTNITPLRLIAAVLSLFAVCVVGPAATASAAPTLTFKTKAVAIKGFSGTGDFLGAGAAIQFEGEISGTEYGGGPPPLVGVRYWAPPGAQLHPQGFATCAPSLVREQGPGVCPRKSFAGPAGSGGGFVSFGDERVHETVSVQPLFAPGGGLEFFVVGHSPTVLELLSTGHVVNSAPPYGPEVIAEVPLVESVPGALDASVTEIDLTVGAAYGATTNTHPYVTLPKRCPKAGLPVRVELSFLGGATTTALYRMPCPKPQRAKL
jgi:hypothetical protein